MNPSIVFGNAAHLSETLHSRAAHIGSTLAIMDFKATDLSGFAAVVPVNLKDRQHIDEQRAAGHAIKAITVPAAVEALCDDKLVLNRALVELGYGEFVPPFFPSAPDNYAGLLIRKRRVDYFGRQSSIVDPKAGRLLADDDYFYQAYIHGRHEYATHILMRDGNVIFSKSIRDDMGDGPFVKGINRHPHKREWLDEIAWLDLFAEMLRATGLTEGTCCIDYKIEGGVPSIFEINPRIGGSLAEQAHHFIPAYLAGLK